jgi:hypothetical protein
MQLSLQAAARCRTEFRAQLAGWLSWAISALSPLEKGTSPCPRRNSSAPEGRAQQAALMASTDETSGPPQSPEFNLTPQNWLAKQPPENAILVYISMPSHQITELRSLPRQSPTDTLDIPMSINPEAKWAQANGHCLRRIDFCSATEFSAHLMAMEALEFLHCARGLLSAELANLDLLIERKFAGEEMAQLDAKVLPKLHKLGLSQNAE